MTQTHSVRPYVDIAIGVLKSGRQVCLSKRQSHQHLAGCWEFPGGKIENGETPEEAVTREVQEELGVTVGDWRPLIVVPWAYEKVTVRLHVFCSEAFDENQIDPVGREGQHVRWCQIEQLSEMDFPAANRGIIHALQLPKIFLSIGQFDGLQQGVDRFREALHKGVGLAQFKIKGDLTEERVEAAVLLARLAHEHGARLLLNGKPSLLERIPQADGVVLSSGLAETFQARPISRQKWLAVSVHNPTQAEHALTLEADFLLISPIRKTTAHPDLTPLEWPGLKAWSNTLPVPVYALGGMTLDDTETAVLNGAQGVALSRGLWPDN